VKELMSLEGRVAVITGGAGHLGRTMADALAECGARIVLVDVAGPECEKVAAEIGATRKVETAALAVDLGDETALGRVPATVVHRFGRLDILINSAALVGTSDLTGWAVPLPRQSSATWRLALEINLTAPFVLVREAAPALAASGHGAVINIGSTYGIVGPQPRLYEGTDLGNPAAYAASKGGLLQLTRWMATVLAPAVRVNAITPGGVWRQQPDTFVHRYEALTPLGRMATEEDFKGAVVYLASDLSRYVTGHNLVVDGGWTTW
jgi:NAD(P)-dependent dehydrogenase (short-subunit alcohol dehydrogenase family)